MSRNHRRERPAAWVTPITCQRPGPLPQDASVVASTALATAEKKRRQQDNRRRINSHLGQLLEEGKTREVLSGFRSKAGKPFRARLVLNEEGKVEFDFPARTQTAEPAVAE